MAQKTSEDWHGCPIRFGATVIGDGWSLLFLRDLMFKNARFYADFLNAGEQISTNILATRLVSLEQEGIVAKYSDPRHGARFIYALTDKGLGLVPVLLALMDWSEKWDNKTEVSAAFAAALRDDQQALALRIQREHEATTAALID